MDSKWEDAKPLDFCYLEIAIRCFLNVSSFGADELVMRFGTRKEITFGEKQVVS